MHDPDPGEDLGDSPSSDSGTPSAGSADTTEIARLFREHNTALLRFVAAKLGSSHEAREVVQEAYVRLLRLEHREAVSYLRAFLFKTAANLAMDRLRQRSRRRAVVSVRNLDFAVFELTPDRQIEGEQSLLRLRKAIAELPSRTRRAFVLHRVHGWTCQQIATRMGVQDRMVRVYIARALEHLHCRVEETDDPKKAARPGRPHE